MRPGGITGAGVVKLAPGMGIAGHFDNARNTAVWRRQVQAVVAAESIGVQVTLKVHQELLRSIALARGREVKDVVRMRAVSQVGPKTRRGRGLRRRLLILDRR